MNKRATGRPRWQLLADDLRQRIDSGDYSPGDQLPAKTALAEQWEVSVNTVERALTELRDEGLVETFHGLGSFVRAREEADSSSGAELDELRERLARLEAQADERFARLETQLEEVRSNLGLSVTAEPVRHRDVG
ncbi:GntR family transcriptional regulator [Nocardia goodfellowii]|uniref:DNA-binding GntR family transcriptional regulator n=1 Tax=Nocardia goodfellowii TaxID=882446 RepID=A0ABS4QS74_9NOCA|nr:winged helix-turn-helix domain-containing protein [Nocardia goodfellowii]MBP2194550.1 DNA-binding GntR family transcriptional regulator [Nocardia goodfellowii]